MWKKNWDNRRGSNYRIKTCVSAQVSAQNSWSVSRKGQNRGSRGAIWGVKSYQSYPNRGAGYRGLQWKDRGGWEDSRKDSWSACICWKNSWKSDISS